MKNLQFQESKALIKSKIESLFEQDYDIETNEVENDIVLQFFPKMNKMEFDEENQSICEINISRSRSAIKENQELLKVSFKGNHPQPIVETFYDFYEEEMDLLDPIIMEAFKRVTQFSINENDTQTKFFVNVPSHLRFQLKRIFHEYKITFEILKDKMVLKINSEENLLARISMRIAKENGNTILKLKVYTSYEEIKNFIVQYNVFTRDEMYLENQIRDLKNRLAFDQKITTSKDIFNVLYKYLHLKDLETLSKNVSYSNDQEDKIVLQAIIQRTTTNNFENYEVINNIVQILKEETQQNNIHVYQLQVKNKNEIQNLEIHLQSKENLINMFEQQYIYKLLYTRQQIAYDIFLTKYNELKINGKLETYSNYIYSYFKKYEGYKVYEDSINIMNFYYTENTKEVEISFEDNKNYNNKLSIPFSLDNFNKEFLRFQMDYFMNFLYNPIHEYNIFDDKDEINKRKKYFNQDYIKEEEKELKDVDLISAQFNLL